MVIKHGLKITVITRHIFSFLFILQVKTSLMHRTVNKSDCGDGIYRQTAGSRGVQAASSTEFCSWLVCPDLAASQCPKSWNDLLVYNLESSTYEGLGEQVCANIIPVCVLCGEELETKPYRFICPYSAEILRRITEKMILSSTSFDFSVWMNWLARQYKQESSV